MIGKGHHLNMVQGMVIQKGHHLDGVQGLATKKGCHRVEGPTIKIQLLIG